MASSKVENHSAFGSKRSRNELTQGDNDWICPKCENLNYGFRDLCNRANCGTPRPPVTSPAHISPYNGRAQPYYFGAGGSVPPIPFDFSGRYGPGPGGPLLFSRMHYDYGSPGIPHGVYGVMPHFAAGPIGGMGYGPGHSMGGYGYGYPGSPWATSDISDNATRKRRGGSDRSFDDWVCPKCENLNFAFRTTCNMKNCCAPRPSSGPNRADAGVPDGSWTCSQCNNINYPYRSVCNRKGCDEKKPTSDK